MPVTRINIPELLELAAGGVPVIDVRSEAEFAHARFPGARSMPLFTNEERKVVGTAYKQESQQKAIKIGLQYFGPKMVPMVEQVEALLAGQNRKAVVLYCWRGGMRSGGVGWLLNLYGFEVFTVAGGYKAFRKWGMALQRQPFPIRVVGGYTGSGKTELLHQLRRQGQAVIDLEGLAGHKGSAFGNIGMPGQPSQEQFENLLALELWQAAQHIKSRPGAAIWVEDESQRIGSVNIPAPLFRHMQTMPVYFLQVPFTERLGYLVGVYGKASPETLVNAIVRIRKRLGGLETQNAINHILAGNLEAAFAILLRYYDKWYDKSLQVKAGLSCTVCPVPGTRVDASINASLVLQQHTQSANAGSF